MTDPAIHPSLYQINTRTWLKELSRTYRVSPSLEAVPDQILDELASQGFDWVWMMGIWQTGHIGKQIAAGIPQLYQEFKRILPDFTDEDICGSPFAVQEFHVHSDFGGNAALRRFRSQLAERGMHLLLDFIPNHTAIDHPWASLHPEYYIQGSQRDWEVHPHDYVRLETSYGRRYLAHGRDPYFPPWSDTLQLNYRDFGLREAMSAELEHIASMCDGVRCDMAMLLLPEVILRTWSDRSLPAYGNLPVDDSFWPNAIQRVKGKHPAFQFIAEVYWDLEPRLLEQGFDFSYDKHLYDYLRSGAAGAVRQHLTSSSDFQRRLVRFLENHDEPRAAQVFSTEMEQAAALLCYLAPGLRFFQHGQLEGHRIRLPLQLCRSPEEACDQALHAFYLTVLDLLSCETLRRGEWRLQPCLPISGNDHTWSNFIAYAWYSPGTQLPAEASKPELLAVVNYSPQPGRCIVQPWIDLAYSNISLTSLLVSQSGGVFHWQAGQLSFALPAWGYQVLKLSAGTDAHE